MQLDKFSNQESKKKKFKNIWRFLSYWLRRQHTEKWFSTMDSANEASSLKSQIYLIAVFQLEWSY